MDRNSAIGLTLIAAILFVYFTWFSPKPQPPTPNQDVPQTSGNTLPGDSAITRADTTGYENYGDLSASLRGEEIHQKIETEDLAVTFSSRGGIIRELQLKNYQTYDRQPLLLVSPGNNTFSLIAKLDGRDLDLYRLFYQMEQKQEGDTTIVSFTVNTETGARIVHRYTIPRKGFEIGYSIESRGLENQLGSNPLTFEWKNIIRLTEKDLEDTRNHSTINYYTTDDGFDRISETSLERETIGSPLQWVAIKQKFFLASIISRAPFTGGEIETYVNSSDPTFVKGANIKLQIPKEALGAGRNDLKFYFGPNDYQIIGGVAEKFARNVYLGWPPVYWINKFVIFPVFHLLTQMFSNYGLIIIILVILLKLVLFPLSYRSYLSMAKMKVLKPELDEIKERVGDDMAKVQQEQMKLYQQVGVNPISGCIPVLLQMPLLLAMFYLFPASIELRQQPFLWAEDLSTYDSLISFPFTIPFLGSHISLFTLLMTASTLISIWQNNQISSVQGPMKSISYIMPVVFFFILNRFSAGLTFYYLVSNLVTFGQQAVIRRFVDENKIRAIMEENKKKNAAGGGGKKSKFMARLEEAMKASEEAKRKAEEERKKKKNKPK